jgi:Domain of unknown function (DUF4833)
MQTVLAVVATVLAAAHGATALADGEFVFPVFHISKSDSRNEVRYRGVVGPDCRFAENPIRVTWFDPEEPPRPLTWLEEQLVYGVRVRESSGAATCERIVALRAPGAACPRTR